jgi:hypothetical protein
MDVADVDGDHQRVEPRPGVRPSGIGATPARQADAVRFDIAVYQLGRVEGARNIDIVVVGSEEEVITEEEVLQGAVRRYRPGESCADYPPRLAPFRSWLPLRHLDPVDRQQEGRGQVGPQRIAVELGPVQRIPGHRHLVARERCAGIVALGDDGAVAPQDRDPIGGELGVPVGIAERRHEALRIGPALRPPPGLVR